MVNDNDLKNIKILFNKCNLSINRIIFKSFTEGIKVIKRNKKDTFIKININKNDSQIIFFYESAFCFFQNFSFGTDIILKDISKVCSINISNVRNIIFGSNFNKLNENLYVDQKYFTENNFRK